MAEFKIPISRFDTNLLPPEARQVGTEDFKAAVVMHFAAEYAAQGQTAMVTVDDEEINVMAFPATASALDFVMPMLRSGRIAEAVPYLESLTKSAPADAAHDRELVDAWAAAIGMTGWYTWIPYKP